MASDIDPLSMLEVSFSVCESEQEEPDSVVSSGGDRIFCPKIDVEPKSTKTMAGRIESLNVDVDSPYLVPLNAGWRREVVVRANSSRKADVYYHPPTKGKKCRSLNDVEKAISGTGLEITQFCFLKKLLGIDDPTKECVRRANEVPIKTFPVIQPPAVSTVKRSRTKSQEPVSTSKKHKKKSEAEPTKFEPQEAVPDETSLNDAIGVGSTVMDNNEMDDREVSSSISCDPLTYNLPTSTCEPENDPLETPAQVSLRSCPCDMCSTANDKSGCCCEIPNVHAVKSDYRCITLLPAFEKLILDSDVLSITRHVLSLKTKNKKKKQLLNTDTPLNITWRYIAYKQFVNWINSCTAIGSRDPVVIPSCVVNAVRDRFPEQNGAYRVLKFPF